VIEAEISSGVSAIERHFPVRIHDPDNIPPILQIIIIFIIIV
jgi:hypothetical protein